MTACTRPEYDLASQNVLGWTGERLTKSYLELRNYWQLVSTGWERLDFLGNGSSTLCPRLVQILVLPNLISGSKHYSPCIRVGKLCVGLGVTWKECGLVLAKMHYTCMFSSQTLKSKVSLLCHSSVMSCDSKFSILQTWSGFTIGEEKLSQMPSQTLHHSW